MGFDGVCIWKYFQLRNCTSPVHFWIEVNALRCGIWLHFSRYFNVVFEVSKQWFLLWVNYLILFMLFLVRIVWSYVQIQKGIFCSALGWCIWHRFLTINLVSSGEVELWVHGNSRNLQTLYWASSTGSWGDIPLFAYKNVHHHFGSFISRWYLGVCVIIRWRWEGGWCFNKSVVSHCLFNDTHGWSGAVHVMEFDQTWDQIPVYQRHSQQTWRYDTVFQGCIAISYICNTCIRKNTHEGAVRIQYSATEWGKCKAFSPNKCSKPSL